MIQSNPRESSYLKIHYLDRGTKSFLIQEYKAFKTSFRASDSFFDVIRLTTIVRQCSMLNLLSTLQRILDVTKIKGERDWQTLFAIMRFFHSILRLFFIYFTITGVKKFYVIPTSLLYKSSVYRGSTVIHVSWEMYNFVYFFSSLAAYCDHLEIPHTCTCTPVYCNDQTFFTFVFHLLPKPTFGYFFVIHLSQV